jgi:hypothetical protein
MLFVIKNTMLLIESVAYLSGSLGIAANGPAIKLVNVAERKTAGERNLNHLTIYLKPFVVEARRGFCHRDENL